MLWVLLAGLAALTDGVNDFLTKKIVPPPITTAAFAQAIVAVFGALGVLAFRPPIPEPTFLILVLLTGGVQALAQPLFVSAVRASPLTLVIPYISLTTVFLLAADVFLDGGRVTALGALGVLLAFAGIFLIHADGRRSVTATIRAASADRGARRMVAASLLFAVATVAERSAVRSGGVLMTVTLVPAVTATLLAAVLVGQRASPQPRSLVGILPIGLLAFATSLLLLLALTLAPLAYIFSIKRFDLPISSLLGVFFLKERAHAASRLAGTGLMAAGAAVILLFGRA